MKHGQMKQGAKKKPPVVAKQSVAKFNVQSAELEGALNKLIIVEGKEGEFKNGVHNETTVKDVNGPQIAKELLKSFLPFKLPPGIDLKSIKTQLANLREELQRTHGLKSDISNEEAEKKLALFKKKKAELKAIEELLGKIEAMNEKFLTLPLVTKKHDSMGEDIDDYVTYLKSDQDPEDELAALEVKINNRWFPEVKNEILSQYPLKFDDDDMEAAFSSLPKETQERFQLLHAEHIVNLLNEEILAMGAEEAVQKEKNKAQIIFQIETSDLHHDIIDAISGKTDENKNKIIYPTYEKKIIDMTMETILKEIGRGQELGAYNFDYDIDDELKELLNSPKVKNLLIEREENENNLTNFEEKSKGYKRLLDNKKEYNITKKGHVVHFRNLYKSNKEKMEECNTRKQELNKELYDIIENFIERNSVKIHQEITEEIQVELGVNIPKEFKEVVDQAEKNSQLGWYDWLSSSTFHSRCKRALIGATTAGATGGLAGTVAGLGIFSPITSTLGVVSGVLLGGAAGFASQNIAKGASDTIAELKNIALSYIYGEENKIASEYFKDATECKGINPKYAPTKKMIQIWGKDGAKIIAYKYINFLFELNVKLLYDPPEKAQKEFLELQYKHFYRNYQMLRCDEEEIRKLYSNEKFLAEDRAQKEIDKAKALDAEDCREHVKKDLASMLSILNKEERDNNINHRKAINMLSNTMDNLVATGDKNLILQLSDSPEVKLIQEGKLPEIKNPPLLLLEGAKIEIEEEVEEEVEEESDALPVLESIVEKKDTKKLALVVKEEDKTKTLALVSPQESRALVEINRDKLQQQEMITEAKKNAVVVANAEKKKEKIDKQYQELNYVAIIANRDKNAATNIIQQYQDFVKDSTQYKPDMSSAEAGECLKMRDYAEFMFWYDTVFLNKYKDKDNQTRKDAISRRLLSIKGGEVGFDGKSIWHLLCDDTIQGHEILTWMFSKQNDQNFKKFINYFDFEYKDTNNKMNAIVYAASRRNVPILKVYINELFKGYTPGTKKQKRCDETFKQIIQLQDPENSIYNIICVKLRDEIKSAWKADQERQYQNKSVFKKIQATFSEQFDSTKVLSQILAAMAIYSTQNQEIPQSERSLHGFLEFLMNNNELVDESVRNLILDSDVRNKVVEQTFAKIESQTKLRDFKCKKGSHLDKIVTNLCSSDPLPTPEEQEILVAMLSYPEDVDKFKQLIDRKPYNAIVRKLLDKKFNDKNLIWLAIEANRPKITGILYNLSNKHAQMDEAGPNNTSAFTFAARKKNKSCFSELCKELSKRTGLTERAYLTRFGKNQKDDRIAFHYIAEKATFEQFHDFLNTEGLRYSNPDWKRLTGMTVSPLIEYKDMEGNLPLHLLMRNENANDIIVRLSDFIKDGRIKGAKSIFDLFDIESFQLPNNANETPMSIIMNQENQELQDALFKPFIERAVDLADNSSYRDNLFKCAKIALKFQNHKLFGELIDCIVKVHNSPKNIGYGIGTNPVTAQVDDLVNAFITNHRDRGQGPTPEEKIDFNYIVMQYLPDLLNLENPDKLKDKMNEFLSADKTPMNKTLMDVMFYSVNEKLTPSEKTKYGSYSKDIEPKIDRPKSVVFSKSEKHRTHKKEIDKTETTPRKEPQ